MTPQMNLSPRAWAELALLSLIWGASFLAIEFALRQVGVLTTVAFRVGGGAVVLWAYVLIRRLPVPRSPRVWGAFLVMGVLNNVIPFSLIVWGQVHLPSGLVSILNGATAVFGVLVAAMLFADERLSARKAFGVGLGMAGVVVVIGIDALRAFDLSSLAQLAVLGASLSYAFASAWARAHFKGLAPQVAAAGMTGFSGAIMWGVALAVEGPPSLDYAPATWTALAYLAIMATALAYLLYYRVLALAGSGNLMLVTLLVTPVAVLLGALVLGETLTPQALAGFGLLALGMLVLDGRLMRIFKAPE
jgi:drug/metabolite transporter (DMT)-like permease